MKRLRVAVLDPGHFHAALSLPGPTSAFDTIGSVRSGVAAATGAGSGTSMAVLSDIRTGLAGGAAESSGGDGAAAEGHYARAVALDPRYELGLRVVINLPRRPAPAESHARTGGWRLWHPCHHGGVSRPISRLQRGFSPLIPKNPVASPVGCW